LEGLVSLDRLDDSHFVLLVRSFMVIATSLPTANDGGLIDVLLAV
jgi:hypothetical protein